MATHDLIFVCSPYRGHGATPEERSAAVSANVAKARAYGRLVILAGGRPVVPHLLYPGMLNDEDPAERAAGLRLAKRDLVMCRELWFFDVPTEGMLGEIALALDMGIPVVWMGAYAGWLRDYLMPDGQELGKAAKLPGWTAGAVVSSRAAHHLHLQALGKLPERFA